MKHQLVYVSVVEVAICKNPPQSPHGRVKSKGGWAGWLVTDKQMLETKKSYETFKNRII